MSDERRLQLQTIQREAFRMMRDEQDVRSRYEAYRQYVETKRKLVSGFRGEVPLKNFESVTFDEFVQWEAELPAREARAAERNAAYDAQIKVQEERDRQLAEANAKQLHASAPRGSQPQPKGDDVGQAFVIPPHVRVLRRLQKAWKALFD